MDRGERQRRCDGIPHPAQRHPDRHQRHHVVRRHPATPATTYSYTVTAVDAAGNVSPPSGAAPATTPADTTPPSVPGGLTATATSPSQVSLSWTASTDDLAVTGYDVLRDGIVLTTVGSTSYINTGLTAGTTYSYTVRARDAAGNLSGPRRPPPVTTPAPDTTGPTVDIERADCRHNGHGNGVRRRNRPTTSASPACSSCSTAHRSTARTRPRRTRPHRARPRRRTGAINSAPVLVTRPATRRRRRCARSPSPTPRHRSRAGVRQQYVAAVFCLPGCLVRSCC